MAKYDPYRNPNMNNKDHQVGLLTTAHLVPLYQARTAAGLAPSEMHTRLTSSPSLNNIFDRLHQSHRQHHCCCDSYKLHNRLTAASPQGTMIFHSVSLLYSLLILIIINQSIINKFISLLLLPSYPHHHYHILCYGRKLQVSRDLFLISEPSSCS